MTISRREGWLVAAIIGLLAAAVYLNPSRKAVDRPPEAGPPVTPEREFCRAYTPAAAYAVEGVVTRTVRNGRPPDVMRVYIKSAGREYSILLCPEPYLVQNRFSLRCGDAVKMQISLELIGGRKEAVAASITHRGKTLRIRDEKGCALWHRGICQ